MRNSASSFHCLSSSSLFVCRLSCCGNTPSHLHYMMFQTIQTIYFWWGYDLGNIHCWVVRMGDVHFSYQCNVFPFLTMRFVGDFLKKTSTSMFLTMFEKTGTSCSRCISEMFFKRLKSSGIFYTHFSNLKQRVSFQIQMLYLGM